MTTAVSVEFSQYPLKTRGLAVPSHQMNPATADYRFNVHVLIIRRILGVLKMNVR
jgi:hypothetical protein